MKRLAFIPVALLIAAAPVTDFELAAQRSAFDDPTYHGAADSCPVWNEAEGRVFVYYTTRRASVVGKGVEWMFGASVGIASTPDGGAWKYEGTAQGDHQLAAAETDKITWWAPHVIRDGDTYHLFVSYVDGIYDDWKGKAYLKHFTSADGRAWKYADTIDTGNAKCIDPCVMKVGDRWQLWYKNPGPDGQTISTASSTDLKIWTLEGPAFPDGQNGKGYEAPFAFAWKGDYWLLVDTTVNGVDVFKSKTAKAGTWQAAGHLWGGHMGVLSVGDKRYVTRHRGLEKWEKPAVEKVHQQTLIDMMELDVNDQGELVQKW